MLGKVSYNLLIVLVLLLSLSVGSAFAAFYKWVDENGNTHYSDVAPKAADTKAQTQEIHLKPMNRMQGVEFDKREDAPEEVTDKKERQPTDASTSSNVNSNPLECFGPSPRTSNTVLKTELLQKSQYKSLLSLLENMKGRWKGEAVVTICNGTAKKPKIEVNKYDTTSEFRLRRSKELVADFEMYSSKLRKTVDDHIKLFLTEEKLSFSASQSDETVALNLSENVIELWVEQYAYYGTRKELVRTFKLQSNNLEVGQYSYSNGELESSTRWSLSKR